MPKIQMAVSIQEVGGVEIQTHKGKTNTFFWQDGQKLHIFSVGPLFTQQIVDKWTVMW